MVTALISQELMIEGDLTSARSVEVQGRIVGDVVASKIEILAGGQLSGTVEADQLIVRGDYIGDVTCSSAMIAAGATVQSNIVAERLSCESGAEITGRLKIAGT